MLFLHITILNGQCFSNERNTDEWKNLLILIKYWRLFYREVKIIKRKGRFPDDH
jgi:hypothetical protein